MGKACECFPLSSLRRGRFVVKKTVEAESFYLRWSVGADHVPLFPCFDSFSQKQFVAWNPLFAG